MWLPENLEPPQEVARTNFHKMKKLRMLIMERASEAFIESCFGQHFRQLKWLHINSHMKQLPKSMQHLNGLIILQLQNCLNLVLIPEFVISNMTLLMHLGYGWNNVQILRSFLKALATSLHYQCWTYLVVIPLNHYQRRLVNCNI